MAEAFHCRLKGPVLVDKKTLMELQGFQAVSARGGAGRTWGSGVGAEGLAIPAHLWGHLLHVLMH